MQKRMAHLASCTHTMCSPLLQLPMGYMQGGAGPTLQFTGGDDPRLQAYGSISAPGPPSLAAFGGGSGGGLSPTSLLQQQLAQQQLAQQQLAQQQGGYGLASEPGAAGRKRCTDLCARLITGVQIHDGHHELTCPALCPTLDTCLTHNVC